MRKRTVDGAEEPAEDDDVEEEGRELDELQGQVRDAVGVCHHAENLHRTRC